MTEHTDKINKQREVIAQEEAKNTLQGFGWQREEIGKANVIRAKYYSDRTEYTYSDKRKNPHTEYKG